MVREQLYERGIRDDRVLEAMLRVPRHVFLDKDAGSEAYNDHSFPIGFAQTMTQPYMVAYLTELLSLAGEDRVLEIGTGSGYQAAVLAHICKEVYTVERVPELAAKARRSLHDLLYTNVIVLDGDGSNGCADYAPFDRVVLTAAARQIPTTLLRQLAEGAILVGPVDNGNDGQEVVRLTRTGNAFSIERLGPCSFVQLIRNVSTISKAPAAEQSEPHGR
jgi:protein-L-isoaspartate(D-aspartate) O-methyltransferase